MNLRSGARIRRYLLTGFLLVFGLTLTGAAYNTAYHNEELEHQREFATLLSGRAQNVTKTMSGYMQSLLATHALFGSSESVTRQEFERFCANLIEPNTGIRAFGWVPRVRRSEEAEFFEAARADGYDFHIFPLGNDALPDEHIIEDAYPVFYIEPYEFNEAALGLDLGSERIRAEALQRARDTGKPSATAPLSLVQDSEDAKSTIVFVPLYSAPSRDADLTWRRAQVTGFVNGVVRFPDLLRDAFVDVDQSSVSVALYHKGELLAGIDTHAANKDMKEGCLDRMAKTERIAMGGRDWDLRFTPTPTFMALHDTTRSRATLLTGLALTLLSTGYLYISMRSAETSHALSQSESRYRALVENAPEAILTIDVDKQCFIDVNAKACTLFGFSRTELLDRWLTDLSPPVQPDGRTTTPAAKQYLQRALNGEMVDFFWTHLDSQGREFPCEIRLVRLPGYDAQVIRGSITDITERVNDEERKALLMRELDHRVKNNLATVLSLTEQSATGVESADELRDALAGRIRAIANLHGALASTQWEDMSLSDVFKLTFAPYNRENETARISYSGPACTVTPDTASAICMVSHELATNAVKYGALSGSGGNIRLEWTVEQDGIAIDWTESGGPSIEEPLHTGYGSRLIVGLVQHQLGGTVGITYPQTGLRCRLLIPFKERGPATYRI